MTARWEAWKAQKAELKREARRHAVNAWCKRNPEKEAKKLRDLRKKNPRMSLAHALKHNYKLTLAEYDALFASQGYACAVCKDDTPNTLRKWHVDHDHTTKKVRGILCHHCNLALGNARDRADILRALATYLDLANS